MTVREQFLQKLYDMAKGQLTTIDRYDVGNELDLPNDETDAIVDVLTDTGKITKMAGSTIMLTVDAQNEIKQNSSKG
jgi:hypothetical protein